MSLKYLPNSSSCWSSLVHNATSVATVEQFLSNRMFSSPVLLGVNPKPHKCLFGQYTAYSKGEFGLASISRQSSFCIWYVKLAEIWTLCSLVKIDWHVGTETQEKTSISDFFWISRIKNLTQFKIKLINDEWINWEWIFRKKNSNCHSQIAL